MAIGERGGARIFLIGVLLRPTTDLEGEIVPGSRPRA